MKKNGFTLLEIMIVIVVIGILYSVISSNGLFAVEKASETAISVDIGVYEIALSDVFYNNEIEQGYDINYLCSLLNQNLDMQFQVQVVENHIESINRESKDGDKYCIFIMGYKNFKLSCGEFSKGVSIDG